MKIKNIKKPIKAQKERVIAIAKCYLNGFTSIGMCTHI